MIRFSCPRCGTRCSAPESAVGKAVKCPGCKNRLEVPFSDSDLPEPSSPSLPVVNLPSLQPLDLPPAVVPPTKETEDYDQKLLDDVTAFLKAQGAVEKQKPSGAVVETAPPRKAGQKKRRGVPKRRWSPYLALGATALVVATLGALAAVLFPLPAYLAGTDEKERPAATGNEPNKDPIVMVPLAKHRQTNVDATVEQNAPQAKEPGNRTSVGESRPVIGKTPENEPVAETVPPKEPDRPVISATMPKIVGKPSSDQVYDRALKSVVWINNPGMGSGSGTLINDKENLVLTNYHVVVQTNRAAAASKERQTFKGTLTKSDRRDISLNLPYKLFDVALTRGQYVFEMESAEIDCYFGILNSANQPLVYSVKAKGGASVYFSPPSDGKYRIMAMTKSTLGSFAITVSELDPKATPSGSWSVAPYVTVNFPEYTGSEVIADKSHYLRLNNTAGVKRKAKILAHSEAKDLAVLKLEYLPAGVAAMPLARIRAKPAQLLHSVGNPGGSGALWAYTSGTARTAPYQRDWKSSGMGGFFNHSAMVIETQSPTNPGDSGGPLFNDNVEMVAVTQGGSRTANSISIFIDVEEVRTFLRVHHFTWVEN